MLKNYEMVEVEPCTALKIYYNSIFNLTVAEYFLLYADDECRVISH